VFRVLLENDIRRDLLYFSASHIWCLEAGCETWSYSVTEYNVLED